MRTSTAQVAWRVARLSAPCMVHPAAASALESVNALCFTYDGVPHMLCAGMQAHGGKAAGTNHVKGAQSAPASNDVEAVNGTAPLKPDASPGRQQKWRWWGYK